MLGRYMIRLAGCWLIISPTSALVISTRGLGGNLQRARHIHSSPNRFPKEWSRCLGTCKLQKEQRNYEEDTIYALSSGGGNTASAVAVIRLTGSQSHRALQILLSKSTKLEESHNVKLPSPRYSSLRMLYDPDIATFRYEASHSISKKQPLDSSLVLLFQAPASFTGEDMVELHCHGSRAVVQGVLESLSKLSKPPYNLSLRPADRGEFTQRAYSHGKLGLLEVEALADLIVADTSVQRLQALRQMDGSLSKLYESWRAELIKGMAHAEAVIDFGDDEDLDGGLPPTTLDNRRGNDGGLGVWGAIRPKIQELRMKMDRHLADAHRGEIARDGVRVAIVGPPNSGKSSLMNLLANRNVAIVSPIAGTTRDVIEVNLDLGGVRCILSDTAGVRDSASTSDVIELEGIRRAMVVIEEAHVVICMVDSTDLLNGIYVINDMLQNIWSTKRAENVLLLLNKADLPSHYELDSLSIPPVKRFLISCETNAGIEQFLDTLTSLVVQRVMVGSPDEEVANNNLIDDGAVITRSRHRNHVENASAALQRFELLSSKGHMAVDMAAEELRLAASELGLITGAVDVEDVLDVLFTDFCIGK